MEEKKPAPFYLHVCNFISLLIPNEYSVSKVLHNFTNSCYTCHSKHFVGSNHPPTLWCLVNANRIGSFFFWLWSVYSKYLILDEQYLEWVLHLCSWLFSGGSYNQNQSHVLYSDHILWFNSYTSQGWDSKGEINNCVPTSKSLLLHSYANITLFWLLCLKL